MTERSLKQRFGAALTLAENTVSFAAISLLLGAVLWGVLTRYITESPAVWASELSGILFTWVVFTGSMTAFREGKHIRVTLLMDVLPARLRAMFRVLADILLIAFLVYVTYLSIRMMSLGATRVSPVMRIPFSWVYLATVISFAVMSATAILRLLGVIGNPQDRGEEGESS